MYGKKRRRCAIEGIKFMTKQDVKRCLKLCRKKLGREINKLSSTEMRYIQKIRKFVNEIYAAESNKTVRKYIRMSIAEGRKDKEILRELPISESTLYRWKQRLTDKVYALCILSGYVSAEEILSEPLF